MSEALELILAKVSKAVHPNRSVVIPERQNLKWFESVSGPFSSSLHKDFSRRVSMIKTAIFEKRKVTLTVKNQDGIEDVRTLILSPIQLILRKDRLYLIGENNQNELERIYVPRIQKIMHLGESSQITHKFNVSQYYKNVFGYQVPQGKREILNIEFTTYDRWFALHLEEAFFDPPARIKFHESHGQQQWRIQLQLLDTSELRHWLIGHLEHIFDLKGVENWVK